MEPWKIDLTSTEFLQNPFPTYQRMRELGPLIRVKLPILGSVWMLTTYDAVKDMLQDQQSFVRKPQNAGRKSHPMFSWWMPKMVRTLMTSMLSQDEPHHRRLRSLVEQAFLRRSVQGMQPRIEELANQFLDETDRRAAANGGRVDLMEHFARPFPLAVICELLGLPAEDRPMFSRWAGRLIRVNSFWGILRAVPGIFKLLKYLRGQFEQCRKRPRPGLISELVQAELEGDKLSEDELVSMAFLLLFAGHETTVHLITTSVLALLKHPDQKDKLLADWSLAGSAVDETLRYMSPVMMTKERYLTEDRNLYGHPLKRGDYLIGFLASANADPAQFDRPEEFDITRHPNPHLTFGSGIHVCLGLKLARMEASVALESLFTRHPDLQLAVPESQLPWLHRIGMHTLTGLPLQLTPQPSPVVRVG